MVEETVVYLQHGILHSPKIDEGMKVAATWMDLEGFMLRGGKWIQNVLSGVDRRIISAEVVLSRKLATGLVDTGQGWGY